MIYKMIDPETVRELSEALEGPQELLAMYQDYTTRDMNLLFDSIRHHRLDDTVGLAHKLTGSFSFIGASAFVQLSRRLETSAAARQDTGTQEELYRRMEQVAAQVLDELRICVESLMKE